MINRRITFGLAASAALTASLLAPAVATSAVATPAAPTAADGNGYCPLSIAHRGGIPPDDTEIPENSMPAFKRAANLGVWAIETDIYYTKDDVAIIMHDEDLDRTTNGTGLVRDHTWAQIKKLRLVTTSPEDVRTVTDYKVPSFQKVLNFTVKRNLTIVAEYKDEDKESRFEQFLLQIEESGAKSLIGGFSKELMQYVHDVSPEQKLMWFNLGFGVTPADVPEGANAGFINLAMTEQMVADMNAAGIQMNVWYNLLTGGDSPEGEGGSPGWNQMEMNGVHWISTDYPKQYQAWQNSTDLCDGRPKTKQKAFCVDPPSDLASNGRTKVLPRNCNTTADKPVKVQVKAKNKSVAKKLVADSGRVSVKNSGGTGKVKVKYHAKGTKYIAPYKKVVWYRIGPANGKF